MAMHLHTARVTAAAPEPLRHPLRPCSSNHIRMRPGTLPAQPCHSRRTRLTSMCWSTAAHPDAASAGAVHTPGGAQYLEGLAGKSFHCTACGKCCTLAADSEVWVSEPESDAIAARLGISMAAFHSEYCQAYAGVPGWRMLQSKPGAVSVGADGVSQVIEEVCTFLDVDTNKCTIHGNQPIQCATFPWWPEMQQPHVWKTEKAALCEGLDHADAPMTDMAEAIEQLQLAEAHEQRFDAAKPSDWNPCLELYPNRQELW